MKALSHLGSLLVVVWLHCFTAVAGDVQLYYLSKSQSWVQTSPNDINRPEADRYTLAVRVAPTAADRVSSAEVRFPSGRVESMAIDGLDDWPDYYGDKQLEPPYGELTSLQEFDRYYPNGSYRLTIVTKTEGTRSIVLTLSGNSYPPTPRISNYLALQNASSESPLTIQWDRLPGLTTTDFSPVEDVLYVPGPCDGPRAVFDHRRTSFGPERGFRFHFSGPAGRDVRLEYSDDFVRWRPLFEVPNPTGELDAGDLSAPESPRRFYRAVLP